MKMCEELTVENRQFIRRFVSFISVYKTNNCTLPPPPTKRNLNPIFPSPLPSFPKEKKILKTVTQMILTKKKHNNCNSIYVLIINYYQ